MRKKTALIPVLSLAAIALVGASLASSFDLSALPDPASSKRLSRMEPRTANGDYAPFERTMMSLLDLAKEKP